MFLSTEEVYEELGKSELVKCDRPTIQSRLVLETYLYFVSEITWI